MNTTGHLAAISANRPRLTTWTLLAVAALAVALVVWWAVARSLAASAPTLQMPDLAPGGQVEALTRAGRGPDGSDVTAVLLAPNVVTFAWADLSQRIGFLVQEDLHEELGPAWSPTLSVGSETLTPVETRVLTESDHHRLTAVLFARYGSAGEDRLAASEVALLLPPTHPGVDSEALRWPGIRPSPFTSAATAAAPQRLTWVVLLGLFGGFLASMWPCLFQLTAYFIPSLAGMTVARAEQQGARRNVRLEVVQTALFFVLGIVIVYTAGGTLAGLAAQSLSGNALFAQLRRPLMVLGALVVLFMALRVAVQARAPLVCKMPVVSALGRSGPSGPLGTMALGLAFATGCMTCFGAAMALGMVTYIFASGSALTGALVMFVFSLGIAVPLVIAAAALAQVMPMLMRLEQYARWLAWASSAVMVAFALFLLTDSYHVVTDWAYQIPAVRRFTTVAQAAGIQAAQQSPAATGASPRLQLVETTTRRPLENGATVPVGNALEARLVVAPFPPALRGNLDIYLLGGSVVTPTQVARVTYTTQMAYMDHGTERGTAEVRDTGHYRVPLNLGMYGDWLVTVAVQGGDSTTTFQLQLAVAP